MVAVLLGSVLVFTAGVLLLGWVLLWRPARRWQRLRPRLVDYAVLAVESDRATAEQVEAIVASATAGAVPTRRQQART